MRVPQIYKDVYKPMNQNDLAPGQAPPELQPEGPLNHQSKG